MNSHNDKQKLSGNGVYLEIPGSTARQGEVGRRDEAVANASQSDEDMLARQADLHRDRLFQVIDELDHRRHKAAKPLVPIALITGTAVVAGIVALVVKKVFAQKKQVKNRRVFFFSEPPEPALAEQLTEKIAAAAATMAISTLGKIAFEKLAHAVTDGPKDKKARRKS